MTDGDHVIRARRTVKSFTGVAVARADLDALLDAARWAPTHRLTQPWRYAVLDQAAISRLAAFLQATPSISAVPDPGKGAAKLAKLLDRLPGLGAMIQATWVRDADPDIDLEEHAAASAALQNLLLAATARGIASFWNSSAALSHSETLRWCGIDTNREGFLGSVWLGYSNETPVAPTRRDLAAFARYL